MKLKKHGAFLLDFVLSYAEGKIDRWEFDLDYSGYVIEHFPGFEAETPRLAAKFARTVDAAYSYYAWMADDAFSSALAQALDEFMGVAPIPDIF